MFGRDDTRFLAGLEEALAHYGAPLLGGDTIAGPKSLGGGQALGLTAIGRATHRPVPSRDGAMPGDALYVTGALGAAMLGLEALRSGSGDSLAYRRPQALLAEGQALAPLVTAMMDLSDGLLLDASRMARASGLTLAIEAAAVPIATPEARRGEALRWGEDYQLLFTASPGTAIPVPAHPIGSALPAGPAPILLDGAPLRESDGLGYEHR
jgi:thiamine-monophosphate kinase